MFLRTACTSAGRQKRGATERCGRSCAGTAARRGISAGSTCIRASPEQYDRARSWWGADVYSTDLGDSVLYAIEGPLLGILEEECPQAVATTIALENGTVPYDEMVMSLRGDHWLHANPPAQEDAATLAIRQRLKTAFYLNDPEWKAAVLAQFRVAMLQALEGLKRA